MIDEEIQKNETFRERNAQDVILAQIEAANAKDHEDALEENKILTDKISQHIDKVKDLNASISDLEEIRFIIEKENAELKEANEHQVLVIEQKDKLILSLKDQIKKMKSCHNCAKMLECFENVRLMKECGIHMDNWELA